MLKVHSCIFPFSLENRGKTISFLDIWWVYFVHLYANSWHTSQLKLLLPYCWYKGVISRQDGPVLAG